MTGVEIAVAPVGTAKSETSSQQKIPAHKAGIFLCLTSLAIIRLFTTLSAKDDFYRNEADRCFFNNP